MLDMIDNNKLTTFPQVYSTFVGLSDQVEHSSSPVGSSENLRDVTHYHTFSGVGKTIFSPILFITNHLTVKPLFLR